MMENKAVKLAVSSGGRSLESNVEPRFGRCRFFIVYDSESSNFEVLDNGGESAPGGAGVQAAQSVARSGAEVVITGNVGPNAFKALEAAGLSVFTGVGGSVQQAIDRYLAGDLNASSGPSVGPHAGMSQR